MFTASLAYLASRFHVFSPDRRGHGRTSDVEGPITYAVMTEDTIAFLDQVVKRPARLVGYSDGAVIALQVALARPDLVTGLVLISGAFAREGWVVQAVPDDEVGLPERLIERYAEVSPDGREHFDVVLGKVADLTREDLGITLAMLGGIGCRALVMVSDDDMVTLEHTVTPSTNLLRITMSVMICAIPRKVASSARMDRSVVKSLSFHARK